MTVYRLVLLLYCLCLAPSAASLGEPAAEPLRLTGSGTMAPLIKQMAKRFQSVYPGVRVDVEAGGSARGLREVSEGQAAIGMVSRAIDGQGHDLMAAAIARDGVALVVHRDNPIRNLSEQQVVAIYSGKIARWQAVGGFDAPILLGKAEAGRSSTELFCQYFSLSYDRIPAQQVLGDNAARVRFLTEHPNAILYMSVGEAERQARAGAPIRPLQLSGIAASSESIRRGDYPLSRSLSLVSKGAPAGWAKVFIEFALSSQVTDLILANDFVPYWD